MKAEPDTKKHQQKIKKKKKIMDISAIVANGLEKTSGSPLTQVGQNIDLM